MSEILHDLIISNVKIAPDIYSMSLESECIAGCAKPGQFVNVKCSNGMDALLRRPISICTVDRLKSQYEIVYQAKGKGTSLLAEMKTGSRLDVLGPLGKPFACDEKYGRIAVAGGGIGIFPLLFLLKESQAAVKNAYLGFRSRAQVVLEEEFKAAAGSLAIATDDGSYGTKGFVTGLLEKDLAEAPPDIIYACGPTLMLKQVARLAEAYGVPCQLSLEQRMGCGFGACLVCACRTKHGDGWEYSHVCKDGPVFWSSEVEFE